MFKNYCSKINLSITYKKNLRLKETESFTNVRNK